MYVGLRINRNGKYACLFCTHKAWKSEGPAMRHVDNSHMADRARLLADKLQEAQDKPPRIEYRERVVYKDKPEKKYWETDPVMLYCEAEKTVFQNTRMPRGQLIENTPCHGCGNRSLKLVISIQ